MATNGPISGQYHNAMRYVNRQCGKVSHNNNYNLLNSQVVWAWQLILNGVSQIRNCIVRMASNIISNWLN